MKTTNKFEERNLMKEIKNIVRSRAQESSSAVEKLYITMRHLFNRGFYKPMGVSGETLREALLSLRPEIYGTIAEEKVSLGTVPAVLAKYFDYSIGGSGYARGIEDDPERSDRFVSMYVNDWTRSYGEAGRRAVQLLLDRGYAAKILPHAVEAVFLPE